MCLVKHSSTTYTDLDKLSKDYRGLVGCFTCLEATLELKGSKLCFLITLV